MRPHALFGEVVVEMVSNRSERLQPGAVLYGDGQELRVSSSKPFKRPGQRWIVLFENVADREAAERLRDVVLFASPLSDPEALWVHELVGSVVRSVSGEELGKVVAVLANPASDLLELDSGTLVPVRFVVSQDGGVVVVDTPPGLAG